jgi:trimethylamine--corrinoid protein Co-methyltransferase
MHAGKRRSGGFSLNVFTDDEIYEIHLATLEVLQKTGVFIEDEEALEIFDGGGATVDKKTKIVKIPPYLVEDSIRSAPSKVFLAGRDPKHDIVLESNRLGFTNFGEGIEIVDLYTGKLRETTKADVAASAVIVDYLSDVDVYERAMGAHDVSQEVAPLHNAEAFLTNTTKHCFHGAGNGKLMRVALDMAAAIMGGKDKLRERPIMSFNTCPVSPLKLVRDCCEIIIEGARSGVMVNVLSQALSGATAPVTLAGTLVVHNAEALSGVVLNQLTCKGAPVMYGSSTCPMDMRVATASVGSPECAMISAAVAQMARYYLLPSWVAGG